MKTGSWYVYKRGSLALFGIASALILFDMVITGNLTLAVFGVASLVMTVRQLQLKGQEPNS